MKMNKIIGLAGITAVLLSGCGGERGDALAAQSLLAVSSSSSSAARVAAPTRWANVKIGGGGYVPGLIFHPTSPDVLYARTDMGGAYRWDAANAAWVPITDGFGAAETFYHGSETIALDPNDDNRVYMSTGMYLSIKPTRVSTFPPTAATTGPTSTCRSRRPATPRAAPSASV